MSASLFCALISTYHAGKQITFCENTKDVNMFRVKLSPDKDQIEIEILTI